eukprot:CAMPEP_0117751468 /NCGR_PEP_ID=MMETSP0947-20121206/10992_1 /TAXON_ID=44440 /ORGANISM="Chattonella subsalsa, Strain CCMP2191" /LENGTH=235 /DNA_ID=CAMNT_0005569853 /DNA_START=232 /DNA_END=939 /DNA_ORIENTATION=-
MAMRKLHNLSFLWTNSSTQKYFCRSVLPSYQTAQFASAGKKEKKRIRKEVEKGHFYEIKELNEHGGKVFPTDKKLRPKSILFPSIECLSLANGESRTLPQALGPNTSLVAISYKQFGFQMFDTWIPSYLENFNNKAGHQLVYLSVVEGFMLKMFQSLLLKSMKGAIPPEFHDTSFSHFGETEELRESLGITNRLSGYLYLVDKDGFIRWRGCGRASEQELEHLMRATEQISIKKS